MELDFITDTSLRQKIENSIEYIYTSYENSKQSDNKLYQTETYRVIIVYTVSIIEAILFYIYETREISIKKIDYKEKYYLPETFKSTRGDGKIILAVEKVTYKSESEIGLQELVQFLKTERVLKEDTESKLHNIIKIRNSVHLRQSRRSNCTIEEVDEAIDLLVYTLKSAPRFLKKTNVAQYFDKGSQR